MLAKLELLGGRAFLRRLIDTFLEQASAHLARMRQARETGDLHTVGRSAHAMISSAGNLGATALSDCARDLERLADEGRTDAVDERLEELEALFTLVRARLESVRRELAT
ncbi:MAG TPA: Hpt domain-containing protein [Gemmatimonadales bacterium]|nr:Hpt domain-containing protein [Gemmatimonadales bacterium]